MADDRTIMIKIGGDASQAMTELNKAKTATEGLGKSFDVINYAAGKLGPVMAGIGVAKLVTDLHAAGMAAERLNNSFVAATGSIKAGSDAMNFVRATSYKLGLDLQSAADGFMKIAASSKGTSLEGEKTERIFKSVAGAASSLGLSADQTNGALLAISQMMSKGTVQAEELRGQLGERLPGSFQIAARAMGVTTAELGKMLQEGKVVADEFLPKFAMELEKTFPPSEKAMAGLTAETNRLKTAWFELNAAVMQNGGETIFTRLIKETRTFTEDLAAAVKSLDSNGSRFLALLMPGVMLTGSKMSGASDKYKQQAPLNAFEKAMAAPDFNGVGPAGGASYLLGDGSNIISAATKIAGPTEAELKEYNKAHKEHKVATKLWTAEHDKLLKRIIEYDQLTREQYTSFYTMAGAIEAGAQGEANAFNINTRGDKELSTKRYNVTPLSKYRLMTADTYSINQPPNDYSFEIEQAAALSHWQAQRQMNKEQETAASQEMAAMRAALYDEGLQLELIRIEQDQQAWINAYAMNTDSYEVYEQRKTQIEQYYSGRRLDIQKKELQQKLTWSQSGFNSMATIADSFYQLTGKKSKEALMAYQVMKSGETVISTASAAMKAYDAMASIPYVGPILGAAAAAAAVASGMVQLQSIWSVGSDGSGGSIGSVGGGGTSPTLQQTTPVAADNRKADPSVNVHVYGNIVDHDQFARELMVSIKKAVNDGY